MQRKLTIAIDDQIYRGLHVVIGPRRISRFIETLVRPHVTGAALDDANRDMAADVAREAEAAEWVEATFRDVARAPR